MEYHGDMMDTTASCEEYLFFLYVDCCFRILPVPVLLGGTVFVFELLNYLLQTIQREGKCKRDEVEAIEQDKTSKRQVLDCIAESSRIMYDFLFAFLYIYFPPLEAKLDGGSFGSRW